MHRLEKQTRLIRGLAAAIRRRGDEEGIDPATALLLAEADSIAPFVTTDLELALLHVDAAERLIHGPRADAWPDRAATLHGVLTPFERDRCGAGAGRCRTEPLLFATACRAVGVDPTEILRDVATIDRVGDCVLLQVGERVIAAFPLDEWQARLRQYVDNARALAEANATAPGITFAEARDLVARAADADGLTPAEVERLRAAQTAEELAWILADSPEFVQCAACGGTAAANGPDAMRCGCGALRSAMEGP